MWNYRMKTFMQESVNVPFRVLTSAVGLRLIKSTDLLFVKKPSQKTAHVGIFAFHK
jgi:hypothetical protein